MTYLPNGILNKKETGCGATSVVLENDENVIVCVPTRFLIENKINQYPNQRCPYRLFPIQQGVTENQIKKYIESCRGRQPAKIMTTYNSFSKVVKVLGDRIDQYKIIVDEFQEILNACVYRNVEIKKLLYLLKGKTNVTYLSATPIPYEYIPEELAKLPYTEIEWDHPSKIQPYTIKTLNSISYVVNLIKRHQQGFPLKLRGENVQDYFFFVNSVNSICDILEKSGLAPEDTQIICANNKANQQKLGRFSIGFNKGEHKAFTFCTKTVFYGADFYSNAGLAIIVSDGRIKNSLLDIATDVRQIAGRIRTRTNPFRNILIHIYSEGLSCQPLEEFKQKMDENETFAKLTLETSKGLTADQRQVIIKRLKPDDPDEFVYYNPDEDSLEMDLLKISHL